MFRWYRARNERDKGGVPEQAFSLFLFCCWTVVERERGEEEKRREEERKPKNSASLGGSFPRITPNSTTLLSGIGNRPYCAY